MRRHLPIFLIALSTSFILHAQDKQEEISPQGIRPCARCVEAREYNRQHPNPYFYYDDYVEASKDKEAKVEKEK